MQNEQIYQRLFDNYEKRNWKTCKELLDDLSKRNPENTILEDFGSDIDIRELLKQLEGLKKRRDIINLAAAVVGALVVITVLIFGGIRYSKNLQEKEIAELLVLENDQCERELESVQKMESQVQTLLDTGNYHLANTIISGIEEKDPDFVGLQALKEHRERAG